jgi:magnesium-transporting ATPase (P-type)
MKVYIDFINFQTWFKVISFNIFFILYVAMVYTLCVYIILHIGDFSTKDDFDKSLEKIFAKRGFFKSLVFVLTTTVLDFINCLFWFIGNIKVVLFSKKALIWKGVSSFKQQKIQ